MADSILEQPALRAPIEFVQGGGGSTGTEMLAENPIYDDQLKDVQLKVLTNGLTVRYVTPAIKDDIMNLRFIEGEQELFDKHLHFNNTFIRNYIGGDSKDTKVSGSDKTDVDAWVKAKVTELDIKLGDESLTTVQEDLTPEEYSVFGTTTLRRMRTSGNDNDCLVHALLTSMSETFRKLDEGAKNTIAGLFRRTVLVELYDTLIKQNPNKEELKTMKKDLLSDINLDLNIATQFAIKYNINILLRDRTRFGVETPWTILNDSPANKIIIIYNPGKNHFEGVSTLDGKYIFDYSFIEAWASKSLYTDKKDLSCKFNIGDIIKDSSNNQFTVLVNGVKDGKCIYNYIKDLSCSGDIEGLKQNIIDGILIKEASEELKIHEEEKKKFSGDALTSYMTGYEGKQAKAAALVKDAKANIDDIPGIINIADTLGDYTLVGDVSAPAPTPAPAPAPAPAPTPAPAPAPAPAPSTAPSTASSTAPAPATPINSTSKPKTSQEKFYDFWEIYINEDGTDGFHRTTGRNANKMRKYLDEIRQAYEKYLLKGALEYLQKKENPVLFDEMKKEKEDNIFSQVLFKVTEPTLDTKKEDVKPEVKPEVNEFTEVLKQIVDMDINAQESFNTVNTLYDDSIDNIRAGVTGLTNILTDNLRKITIEVDKTQSNYSKVRGIIGDSEKKIIELKRKNDPKKLESTIKFKEESSKIFNSIEKYKEAILLAKFIIETYIKKGASKRGRLADLYNELKIKYDKIVNSLRTGIPIQKEIVGDEDEGDEDYVDEGDEDDDDVSLNNTASGDKEVAASPELPGPRSIRGRPKKNPITGDIAKGLAEVGAAVRLAEGRAAAGRPTRTTAGKRNPRYIEVAPRKTRKTRKALSKLSH